MTQKTRMLQEEPDKKMLARLRVLEKKMGLVLTLASPVVDQCFSTLLTSNTRQFKASVWGVINEQAAPDASDSYEYDNSDNTIRR
jgi:DASH complex subunit DAD3